MARWYAPPPPPRWALSNCVPHFEALGHPHTARVMSPIRPLLGHR